MRIWRFPDQVIRLAILFGVAIVALIFVRARFVPESFGELGHFRASVLPVLEGREIVYAGRAVCVECHDDQGEIISASYHRNLSCEVCHGPAAAHADDPDAFTPVIPTGRGEACLYCHEYLSSRPTGFPQIVERTHNPLDPCVDCHNPHDPTPPDIPETCAACHQEIARTKAVSHHQKLACVTCHETSPEHRENPRAHRPKKPTNRDFCGGCHDLGAEGMTGAPRIDLNEHGDRYLCWQCHYPHDPEG